MQRIFKKEAIVVLGFAFLCLIPGAHAYAKSATWTSQNFQDTLAGILYSPYFCWRDCSDNDPDKRGYTTKYVEIGAIANPSASVTHAATILDNTTGANIDDNGSVSVGDTITITPQANQSTDISWFATGWGTDSPYGSWGGTYTEPSENEQENGFLNYNTVLTEAFYNFANLAVQPTTPTISTAGSTAGLSNTGGGSYKVTSAGTIVATVSYPATTGQFYYSYYKTGQIPPEDGDYSGPDGPNALTIPMADGNKLNNANCYFEQNDPGEDDCLADPANSFDLAVPVISIQFTGISAKNTAPPPAPTVSGATTGDDCPTSVYTYTFTGTDPGGNTIRYGVDWNNDGTVDEWVPASGYVPSGTPQSTTHSWTTTGNHTFEVLTQNSQGAVSGWTQYTTTISSCPMPSALLTATPPTITTGQSTSLQWTCTNSSSASIDNGVGTVTPTAGGTTSVSPTTNTTYTLTCTGAGGTNQDTATVTVTPLSDLTAAIVPGQDPLSGTVGVPVSVEAQISNIGAGPTNQQFWTTFWVADQGGDNKQYFEFPSGIPNGFNPGASEIDPVTPNTVQFTFDTPGTYVYRACADRDQNMNETVPQSNDTNDCSQWAKIVIAPPQPSCSLTANPLEVPVNGTSNISWTSSNTTSCTGSGFDTGGATSGGPVPVGPLTQNESYGLECTGLGNASCNATPAYVIVDTPTATLTANPTRVANGGKTALTWSSTYASSCTMTRNGVTWTTPGTKSATSSTNVTDNKVISTQTIYVLNCSGATAQAIVNVAPGYVNY
jgi:hypothetical protein